DRNKVWGYLINDAALLQYGLQENLGTADTPTTQENTIYRAGIDLSHSARASGHVKFTSATTARGSSETCFALARVTDDPQECFGKPPRELIDRLKEVLKTDKEPRWYYW
ncbi:hypothetical protein C0993_011079, partial [Termitomyces sp. T159_Od127]